MACVGAIPDENAEHMHSTHTANLVMHLLLEQETVDFIFI